MSTSPASFIAPAPASLAQRLGALNELLQQLAALWRPQPFKQRRPPWCVTYPALDGALLALSEVELAELRGDDRRLWRWLARYEPAFGSLEQLLALEELTAPSGEESRHLEWAVPGRKWSQISAFAGAIGPVRVPLLEWCGGKGHLGRLLGARWDVPVTTLEHNAALCSEGEGLARRARVAQRFERVDVLSPLVSMQGGRHAIALHACGELHRRLLRKAVAERAPALDVAPCCYHLGVDERYRPFTKEATLHLSRDDLRLAVTETVTSKPREVRLRDREMAWKLGFLALLADHGGGEYRPLRPIDKAWLDGEFSAFCRQLAEREGVELPAQSDWMEYEARGWQRQGEVMRLSLPRHAVRRAVELYLVLDAALYLQRHGYAVRLATFCAPELTPRNILISARLIP